MKKFLPLLLILIINIPSGFCSDNTVQTSQFPNYGILHYFVPSPNVKNTNTLLYDNDFFLPGKIVTHNKSIISLNGMRYNITEDAIECQINKQYCRISSPNKISEVEINDTHYVYKKYLQNGDSIQGYLQKIYTGQQNLYVKHFIKKSKNLDTKCDIKSMFFIEREGGLPQKVHSLRLELLKIYKSQTNSANLFMKNNNYKWNDSKALVQLVNYLEELAANNVASR
ncbi:hypothetical protein [Marinifilum fragile]|uniref:hypothetical protein n=1 Tax=Marinifilum fragile TaxID=570161 RepID=UPI002AA8786C|nr:hypothetical protein [Marinifilum fragile]